MWPPHIHVWINNGSRSTNQNIGRPRNVALIGMIPNTHKSGLKFHTHQSRQKLSYLCTKLSH